MKPVREQIPDEALCPKCGLPATWIYTDAEETQVRISCADCGGVAMTRGEFETAEADIAEPNEPGE
jgi:hypothetical protein